MNKPLDTLLQKEMTRKEFIATLGFGIASIMGFSGIIRLLIGQSADHSPGKRSSLGYGYSPYGGGHE